MKGFCTYFSITLLLFVWGNTGMTQKLELSAAFLPDSIEAKMYLVNDHFLDQQWKRVDRNWIRGTYFTGLMAFYETNKDPDLLSQAMNWAARHGWRTGTEWFYPANRMTCVQTYLQLYFIDPNEEKIENARQFMEKRIYNTESAADQGWDYVDALYVGTPAYMMMAQATGNTAYSDYGHKMFSDVYKDLYDSEYHLFYRDEMAKEEKSEEANKIFWSRGNGWAMASLPRILDYLPEQDTNRKIYILLLQQMAAALAECQGNDGFWRVNLADSIDYPAPESSGTAFFTYAIAWGINQGYLDPNQYQPIINKSWAALYLNVDEQGKVLWGQGVARGPEKVSQEDSHEYVWGAFLLAGSEMEKLIGNK